MTHSVFFPARRKGPKELDWMVAISHERSHGNYVKSVEQETNVKSSILYLYRHASGWVDGRHGNVKEVDVPPVSSTRGNQSDNI